MSQSTYSERLRALRADTGGVGMWATLVVWVALWIYTASAGWWTSGFWGFVAGFFGSIVVSPIIAFAFLLPVLALFKDPGRGIRD